MDGKEDFPAFDPFYRVNLCDREVRIFFSVIQILRVGPAIAALFIDLPVFPALPFGKPDSAGKVNVPGSKKIRVDQAVESTFTDHNGILVVLEDMVEGLPFEDERGDDGIQVPDFIFGQGDPFPCFCKKLQIFFLCRLGPEKPLFKCAGMQACASIADIGWGGEPGAYLFFVIAADRYTFSTGPAIPAAFTAGTKTPAVAAGPMGTVIERFPYGTGSFRDPVAADLF